MSATEAVQAPPTRRLMRALAVGGTLTVVLGLMFGVPWWMLVGAVGWPSAITVTGTVLFVLAAFALPVTMFTGHGRGIDWASRIGDTLLGLIWVLFTWSIIGSVARLFLDARTVAISVMVIAATLSIWGYAEAMRVPRVRRVDITVPRLGPGLDGLKVALLTDTHYGPINRARWSAGVVAEVNKLDADIVCHTGDIADGTVEQRREQAAPLGIVQARLAKTYVTGNHEYFGSAQGWLDHMQELGWDALHNRHLMIERGGDRLVLAGIHDRTAKNSGTGHRADLTAALAGADPDLPVLLLAHQPKQVDQAVAHGVDVQISGHTHGGQIWPFNFLVRLDQPVVQGLSRHGERTQMYTSRGTGFWGPPLRIFAPSEITLITLRAGATLIS